MAGLQIDHIVYAAVDLDAARRRHRHPLRRPRRRPAAATSGVGTRNHLLSLRRRRAGPYLELIGPDPTQQRARRRRPLPFGIDRARPARGWSASRVKAPNIDARGGPGPRRRLRPRRRHGHAAGHARRRAAAVEADHGRQPRRPGAVPHRLAGLAPSLRQPRPGAPRCGPCRAAPRAGRGRRPRRRWASTMERGRGRRSPSWSPRSTRPNGRLELAAFGPP